jgi:hypothetical protein
MRCYRTTVERGWIGAAAEPTYPAADRAARPAARRRYSGETIAAISGLFTSLS